MPCFSLRFPSDLMATKQTSRATSPLMPFIQARVRRQVMAVAAEASLLTLNSTFPFPLLHTHRTHRWRKMRHLFLGKSSTRKTAAARWLRIPPPWQLALLLLVSLVVGVV